MSPGRAVAGAVLSGGRSSRMGGGLKALRPLQGRSMIEHVIDRFSPQVEQLYLSVDQPEASLRFLGLEQVSDRVRRHRGPLVGLWSAMLHACEDSAVEWLVLCPCDAPFLPGDLVEQLTGAAQAHQADVCLVQYDRFPQPTFSAWNRRLLPVLENSVMTEGGGGLMRLIDGMNQYRLEWPESDPNPFFNVNTPEQLAEAEERLPRPACSAEGT